MKKIKVLSYIMLLLFALELVLTPSINIISDSSTQYFQLVDTFWGSKDEPKNVYPGSKDVTLVVLVTNNFKDLVSVTGCLQLPQGFTDIYGSNMTKAVGFVKEEEDKIRQNIDKGETFEFNFNLNVNSSLAPGTYYATIELEYKYLEAGELKSGSSTLDNVPLKVSDFPKVDFSIDNIYWSATDGSYINATPGGRNLILNLDLKNIGEANLSNVDARLYMPNGFKPDQVSVSMGALTRGSIATLSFTGIHIDYEIEPRVYYGTLEIESTFRGYGGASKTYYAYLEVPLKIYDPVNLSLAIISVGWSGLDTLYSGSREIDLEVKVQNIGFYRIGSLTIYLYLPNGFETASRVNVLNETFDRMLDYGDIDTFSLGPIYVSNITPGLYNFTLLINGFAYIGDTILKAHYSSKIHLRLTEYNSSLVITSIEYNYNGQPGPLLPGAKGIEVIVNIANWGIRDVSAVDAKLTVPDGFNIYGVNAPSGVIPSSTTFTVSFFMNISSWVKPGTYPVALTITYIIDPNGAKIHNIYTTNIDIVISDPRQYSSNLQVVSAYWGVNQPIEVYPGAKMTPLSIILLNGGPYDIRSLRMSLDTPKGFTVIYTTSSTADAVLSLDVSSLTCYINVDKEISPGNYRINATFSYILSIYGSDIKKRCFSYIYLYVYPPPSGLPYIKTVDYYWENNYRVYPNTKDAKLNIILADESPYPISGVNATLVLPDGFRNDDGNYVSAYVSGPINSWQTFTLRFEIDVGDVKPGTYSCNLILHYILQSGGEGYPVTEYHLISINVDKLSGIEFTTSYWLSGSAGPGAAGVHLLTILRNIGFDRMYGVVAKVILPDGVVSTVTGTGTFNVTPYVASSAAELAQLASSLQAGYIPTQAVSGEVGKGDFIVIPMTLNFNSSITPGRYKYSIILFFLDEWDCNRALEVNATMWVLGRTENILVLENKSAVFIGNRRSQIVLYLLNNGSGPMYDVYVSISSLSSVVSFSSAVKYIPVIIPKQTVKLSWYASSSGQSYTGSIPALVTILYIDPSGMRVTFNQTVILYVEGIAELKLIDISVEPSPLYANSEFTISATIVNLGTDTARGAEVFIKPSKYIRLNYTSYSYVGDIDVSSQMPITLYGYIENYTGTLNITIVVRFMNAFYEPIEVDFPITVEVYPKPPTKPEKGILDILAEESVRRAMFIGGIIAIVAILLGIGICIVISKLSKSRKEGV